MRGPAGSAQRGPGALPGGSFWVARAVDLWPEPAATGGVTAGSGLTSRPATRLLGELIRPVNSGNLSKEP